MPAEEKTRIVLSISAGGLSTAEAVRRAKCLSSRSARGSGSSWRPERPGLTAAGRAGPSHREQLLEAEVADLTQALGEAAV